MAGRDSFDEAEWDIVVQAPMLAGFAVTAADPGGLIGAFQESAALARSMASMREHAAEGGLLAEIVAAYETAEGRAAARDGVLALTRGHKPAEATEAAVARLAAAAASVRDRTPEEAPAFAGWMRDIATAVAEAASEGGLLGFGGEQVSHAERRTLDDIAAAVAGPSGPSA